MVQICGPATPGFLTTLTATILLGVVSFCVPYVKSVYFLKAAFSDNGHNGTITFGTLGYCLELSNGTTCSNPSVGYQLDIDSLVGNETGIDIPQVAVKWLTYALVLHIVAFVLAGASTVFGLLAHVCQIVGTCCSTCVSGFSATVALLAFIFDIAFFSLAKKRINDVGSATTGNAMWLTLAAFLLLTFTGCFYAFGSCCIPSGGSRKSRDKARDKDIEYGYNKSRESISHDAVRMEAVRAEADRQAFHAEQQAHAKEASFTSYTPYTSYPNTSGFIGQQPYSDHPSEPSHGSGHAAEYYSGGYPTAGSYTAAPPPGPTGYDGPPGYDGHAYPGGYQKIHN